MSTTNATIFKQPLVLAFTLALCALLACALQGALFAGVARAEIPRLVPDGNFHVVGAAGVAVDNSCPLHTPSLSGSACASFDPSADDVFVAGFVGGQETGVVREGVPEAELQFGPPIEKLDASGKALTPPAPFDEGAYNYGAAVNPTNGDLYVASAFGEIDIYDPQTGGLLSSFAVPPFSSGSEPFGLFENTAQIATDSVGDVYVPNVPDNEVLEYSPTGAFIMSLGGKVDQTTGGNVCTAAPGDECVSGTAGAGGGELNRPTGVAVDPSGNVWIADHGNNRVQELGPSGAFVGEFASAGVRALAVDAHGDVFAVLYNSADFCGSRVSPCAHLVEYSSTGAQLADVGAGDFGSLPSLENDEKFIKESMVAVDDSSGQVYVTDGLKDLVWVFRPPVAPVLGQESAVEVGTSEAKLGALVNPGGAQTTYRFEYDTREYQQGEAPHGVSVPFPEGIAGEGFSSRTVWASAKGLEPGTTYHYRVIVTSALGTVVGPDQTFTTETAAQIACPNEQSRGGFSAALPDCRAYELVTPPSKASAQPDTGHTEHGIEGTAAIDGDRFSYPSAEVMPGSQSAGLEFMATRGEDGWSSQDALPLQPYSGDRCPFQGQSGVLKYSADLSKSIVAVNVENKNTRDCLGETVEIVSGEPLDVENLLLHDNEDGAYQLINLTPPGVTPTTPSLVAASADLNLVVFSERAKLTPEAQNNTENLYEWSEGVVRLLKLELPSGAPVAGTVVSVSNDGSDVFFTADGNLYVRLNGGERTVQLDEARGGSGAGGGGAFAAVTAAGSRVFFTDNATAGLTSDTVPGSGTNLYSYDVSTGQLSDLTPVGGAEAALVGISEDGSYVYFAAKGVLSGAEANQSAETAQSGQENLYLDHDGTITFVTHAAGHLTYENGNPRPLVSSNGEFLGFESNGSPTGYDSDYLPEIYLYSAAAKRFECASCNPDGEAPSGGVALGGHPGFAPHFVSNNGQVFFATAETLLPRDTNGTTNVYEFDYASGIHLISTGTSSVESFLLEASPSGDDVFFLTRQQLVPQDSFQEANKIYDARVDGGFPEPPLPPACTTADACRSASPPQPSIYGAPSSQTFSGEGNVSPAPSAATVKTKALTRSQKLANALAECKKDKSKSKRAKCEKTARKKYAAAKKAKKSARANRRDK
jgi:hypothetical protein